VSFEIYVTMSTNIGDGVVLLNMVIVEEKKGDDSRLAGGIVNELTKRNFHLSIETTSHISETWRNAGKLR